MTPISHLQYTDDSLLFLDGGKDYLSNLISLIHCFELVLVMKINWKKSCMVGINSNPEEYEDIAQAFDCQIRKFYIDYFGALLGVSPLSREFWIPVSERCK